MSQKTLKLSYKDYLSFCKPLKEMQSKLYISKDAIQSRFVKTFFTKHFSNFVSDKCCILNKKKRNCIPLTNQNFQNILRAAIRYYYDEEEYNSHASGSLEDLLGNFNKILKFPVSEGKMCEALAMLLECGDVARKKSNQVSLFLGTDKVTRKYRHYKAVLNPDGRSNATIRKKDLVSCAAVLKTNVFLFRGRPKYDCKKYLLVKGEKWSTSGKVPLLSKKDMGMSPINKKSDSRCGRLFYCASDLQVVISELKQKLDTYVSVGCFKAKRKIKVINLSDLDYYNYTQNDKLIERYIKLKAIHDLFMMPVNDQNKNRYKETQNITEIVKNMGYNGVIYNSSVSRGKNYAFFTDKNFNFIEKTAKLVKIKKIEYSK